MKIKLILFTLSFVNIANSMNSSALHSKAKVVKNKKMNLPSLPDYIGLVASDYELKAKKLGNCIWSLQALTLIKIAKIYNGEKVKELPPLCKDNVISLFKYLKAVKSRIYNHYIFQNIKKTELIESVLALTPKLRFDQVIKDIVFFSADNCNLNAMEFFLQRNFKINERWGFSPLHIVCRSVCDSATKKEAIQFLIKNGADINNVEEIMGTPLMSAIDSDDAIEIISYLLELGADINKADRNRSKLPLILAVNIEDEDLVSFLLAHGADASLRDNFNQSALDHAYQDKNAKIIKLLEDHLKKQEENISKKERTVN